MEGGAGDRLEIGAGALARDGVDGALAVDGDRLRVPQEGDGTQVSVAVQVVGPHGEQATTSTSFTVHR